jgi:hypothetical protein
MATAKNNDHISKLAADYGLQSWETLWDANKGSLQRATPNQLFKGKRLDGNGGDKITVPPKGKEKEGGSTGVFNKFKVKAADLFIRLRILKDDYSPLANAPYELDVAGHQVFTGKTDANGQIKHPILKSTTAATLTVRVKKDDSEATSPNKTATPDGALAGEAPIVWTLRIGALNPICEPAPDEYCVSGVQQRLNNLNINTALIDGINGPNTTAAIESFQEIAGIKGKVPKPGVPDKAMTQEKLRKVHDGPAPVHPSKA